MSGQLADANIASAATWNAKQNALTINDSKPITIGTAAAANTVTGQAHTHDGITSIARASVTNIDITNPGTEPARMTLSQVTQLTTGGTDPGDGYVVNLLWDNAGNWDTQLYVPNAKKADKDYGHLKVRYKNESSTWGDWEYLPGAFMGTLLDANSDLDMISAPQKGVAGEVIQYYWRSTSKPKSTSSIGQTGMDATTGLPTGTGSANLFVFEQSNNRTESRYLMQLMVCADNGIWVRRQFGGTWNVWSKVLTSSDITTNTSTKNGIITVAGTDKTVYVHPVYDAAFNRANNTASADQCWAKIAEMSFDITASYAISGTWKVYCSNRYAHTGILEFHSFISASSTSATFGQVELKWIGTEPISFRDYNFCMVLKAKTASDQPVVAELWCQCSTSQRGISITEIGGNGWNANRMTNDRRWVYFNPADSEKTTKPVATETIQVVDPIPEVFAKSVYKEFTLPNSQISYIKINATSWHHQQMFVYSAEGGSLHGEYILRSYSNGGNTGTCQVISLCGGQYTENVEWYTKANARYIKFDLSSATSNRTYRFGLTELSGGRASDFELVSELPNDVAQITPTGPSARKLDSARKLKTKLDSTADATFDGSNNQEAIPVTGTLPVGNGGTGRNTLTSNAIISGNGTGQVNMIATASGALFATAANGAASFGTLPLAQGGTGATSASDARTNLGVPPTSHTDTNGAYGKATTANYGHVKIDNSAPLQIGSTHTDGVATGLAHYHNGIGSIARTSVTTPDIAHINTDTKAHMFLSQITTSSGTTHDPGDGYLLTFMWDTTSPWDTQLHIPDAISPTADYGRLKFRSRGRVSPNTVEWGDWQYLPAASTGTLLTSSDNINNIKGNKKGDIVGYYWVSTSMPTGTLPFTESSGWGAELVVYNTADNYCIQVCYRASKGIYQRLLINSQWGAWSKVMVSGDITADTTNELSVMGIGSSDTTAPKYDTNVTVQGGNVKATTYKFGTNASMTYNSTTESIDFSFT